MRRNISSESRGECVNLRGLMLDLFERKSRVSLEKGLERLRRVTFAAFSYKNAGRMCGVVVASETKS